MSTQLKIDIGKYSNKGRKEINQDFHAVLIPNEPQLSSKGVVIALADGISSSEVSQQASQTAVSSFLEDYYCTSEAWSVKTSAQRVILAINSWLYSQTRKSQYRYERDKGYVCTFTAMVIKSTTAHIFHAGDSRVYRMHERSLEQLTEDHRLWVSSKESYLNRALGVSQQLDIDYQSLQIEEGDVFLFCTDGIYEFVSDSFITHAINESLHDLEYVAKQIVEEALKQGSDDNLTILVARIEQLPVQSAEEAYQSLTTKPFPPLPEPGKQFDGYNILRKVHASNRSHVYLAQQPGSEEQVIIKIPSIDQRHDPAYLERFLMEEWIAQRIANAHVVRASHKSLARSYIYTVTEYIEGQTLKQWMIDNPRPGIEPVRGIIEQVIRGLRAFHRQEMLHQDLRPDNIMIDQNGTVKLIDFGSARVAGVSEINSPIAHHHLQGTALYSAPEYFLGEAGSVRSDLFSLGIITYQMLSGRLPYGVKVARCKSRAAQMKLKYESVVDDESEIPAWIDEAIKKAVHTNPQKRYGELSEFLYDLRHPNKAFLDKTRPPLIERRPVLFWKGVSFVLSLIILALLIKQSTIL